PFGAAVRCSLMTVPAHAGGLAAAAAPTAGVRVAAEAAHLVAVDAVGGGPLVMAAGAQKQITPRLLAVEALDARAVADPARRMWVPGGYCSGAHAAPRVAAVAGRRFVAGLAARGSGLSF